MGQLEGNLARNSDGSTFGASAAGSSPADEFFTSRFYRRPRYALVHKGGIAAAWYQTFGDPAYDDEHYLKSRGVW